LRRTALRRRAERRDCMVSRRWLSQMTALCIASLALTAWVYLLLLRGGFWRAAERDDGIDATPFTPDAWPRVVAIVPARNEAPLIAHSVGSLLRQNYPGAFDIIVVDDHSTDDTAAIA